MPRFSSLSKFPLLKSLAPTLALFGALAGPAGGAEPLKDAPEPQPENPLIPPPALVAPSIGVPESSESAQSPQSKDTARSRARVEELQIPIYQRVRPTWGTDLSASLRGLGSGTEVQGATSSSRLNGFSLRMEYQPAWIQAVGVFGLGLSFQSFTLPEQLGASGLGSYSVGAQARYQLRLLREQWIVPYAGYAVERVAYRLRAGGSGSFLSQGPFFGAALLLNFLEPSVAADAYAGTGIVRTYLFAELRTPSTGDSVVRVSGRSPFFGLRFEY
jgi:hypothetical protein